MGDLSAHFSASEFACHCCGQVRVAPELMVALEELRAKMGEPLTVLSGSRCFHHNRFVGGSPKSQHLIEVNHEGHLIPQSSRAADIAVPQHWTLHELFHSALSVPSFARGGLGVYQEARFVHMDVRPNGPARWAVLIKGGPFVSIPKEYLIP